MPLSRECDAIELLVKSRFGRNRSDRAVLQRLWVMARESASSGQREHRVVGSAE
jgi:hypothetical protein